MQVLFSWQGQRNLVSPAGSVGASAPLDTLRVQYSKRFVQAKSEIVRFAHGEIICSANCDICRFASSEMKQIPHRRSDFTRRRRISRPQGISQIPKGIYFVKKSTCICKCFFSGSPCWTRTNDPAVNSGCDANIKQCHLIPCSVEP